MFSRTTIFLAVVSGTLIALALLAQATHFDRVTLWFGFLLMSVALFIGLTTFVRSVVINYEDARWVKGMNLLRQAYLKIVPGLQPFLVTGHEPDVRSLSHGVSQRFGNLANSLTTTSSVVAAVNSILAGSIASDLGALVGGGTTVEAILGAFVSLTSAYLHVRYAARFRERHAL
jgi:hypothetical protein